MIDKSFRVKNGLEVNGPSELNGFVTIPNNILLNGQLVSVTGSNLYINNDSLITSTVLNTISSSLESDVLNLYSITNNTNIALVSTSGSLQTQINNAYLTTKAISGTLLTTIRNVSGKLHSEVMYISGAISNYVLTSTLSSLSGNFALNTDLLPLITTSTVSSLTGQITTDIKDLTGQITNDYYSLISSISANDLNLINQYNQSVLLKNDLSISGSYGNNSLNINNISDINDSNYGTVIGKDNQLVGDYNAAIGNGNVVGLKFVSTTARPTSSGIIALSGDATQLNGRNIILINSVDKSVLRNSVATVQLINSDPNNIYTNVSFINPASIPAYYETILCAANISGSVSIGANNTTSARNSLAFGENASVFHNNSFVWSDGTLGQSSNSNTFNIFANNGAFINGKQLACIIDVQTSISAADLTPLIYSVSGNLTNYINAEIQSVNISITSAANPFPTMAGISSTLQTEINSKVDTFTFNSTVSNLVQYSDFEYITGALQININSKLSTNTFSAISASIGSAGVDNLYSQVNNISGYLNSIKLNTSTYTSNKTSTDNYIGTKITRPSVGNPLGGEYFPYWYNIPFDFKNTSWDSLTVTPVVSSFYYNVVTLPQETILHMVKTKLESPYTSITTSLKSDISVGISSTSLTPNLSADKYINKFNSTYYTNAIRYNTNLDIITTNSNLMVNVNISAGNTTIDAISGGILDIWLLLSNPS